MDGLLFLDGLFGSVSSFPGLFFRLGRFLINQYLISQGFESARAVSFSMRINENRAKYDGAFVDSENSNADCTPFLEYMLDIFIEAYESALYAQNRK